MASAQTLTGIFLVVGLIGLGVAQMAFEHLPASTLAGAVTAEEIAPAPSPAPVGPTQREINLCMNECMQGCVVNEGDEPGCIAQCEPQCGV